MNHEFEITFSHCDSVEAGILAQELEHELADACPESKITRRKSRSDTLDFGSTLVLVLGAPATIIAAKAIQSFLNRNSGARLTLWCDGTVYAENLSSRDAVKIAEAFAKKQ